MKRKAVICDIDNTILNIMHRWHLLKGAETDWEEFLNPDLIMKDSPMQDTIDVINCLSLKYPILFVTGRNAGIREITAKQIEMHTNLLNGYELIMRPDEDQVTADSIIKTNLYKEYVEPYYDVICAIDDKLGNIELWRSFGITAYHCGELGTGEGF